MSGRSAMRAAMGNRDANHSEITKAYEELYCLVQDTHAVGCGFGDIVVRVPTKWGAVVAIVEIKTTDGTLRASQERFIRDWGAVVEVVQTKLDVFAHVERIRSSNGR